MNDGHAISAGAHALDLTTGIDTFESFFDHERGRLFRSLCLITHDRYEAEDLTQETFVRLFERWDRISPLSDPKGYLYRTAMNLFRSRRRRSALMAKRVLGLGSYDDGIAAVDERDATVRVLARLPRQQRAAIVLIDLLDFPSDEAAKLLHIRPSTTRMHLSRARAVLKETMEHA